MTSTRLVSAVVIAAVLLAMVLLVPPLWSAAALSLILLAAAWEWSTFLGARVAPRVVFFIVLVALCAFWWRISAVEAHLLALLWVALGYWTLVTAWMAAGLKATRALVVIFGLLSLSFAWVALIRARLDWEQGAYAVLYSLLIVWLADSGAYFAGRRWGGAKLAPAISPGKTWAGMWGGLAMCALLALGVSLWRALPLWPLLLITMVVGVYSVVGDLAESFAKRFAGVKDSGHLIPGHGGVLDRFDSLLAAAPVLMLGLLLFPELRG